MIARAHQSFPWSEDPSLDGDDASVFTDIAARFAISSNHGHDIDLSNITFGHGDADDVRRLSMHHYRSSRTGVLDGVFVARHRRSRLISTRGDRSWQLETVGVLGRTHPTLASAMRRRVAAPCYEQMAHLSRTQIARRIGREFRTLSRVIVDPRYRGLGLATRLVRMALDEPSTTYTEAVATMAWVHPFFERAGMTAYPQAAGTERQRVLDALDHLDLNPLDLFQWKGAGNGNEIGISTEKNRANSDATHSCAQQRLLKRELRRWAKSARRLTSAAAAALTMEQLTAAAARSLFLHPVYYLSTHDGKTHHATTNEEGTDRHA